MSLEKLSELVSNATVRASKSGALFPLQTSFELFSVLPSLPPFILRVLLSQKQAKPTRIVASSWDSPKAQSPFLHPDPMMIVEAPLRGNSKHNLLLNKFPVVEQHLLLCTWDFASQEDDLTSEDLQALKLCSKNSYAPSLGGALCFYNCGIQSGASQGHKHMQMIPRSPNLIKDETNNSNNKYFLDGLAMKTTTNSISELGIKHSFFRFQSENDDWNSVYQSLLQEVRVGNHSSSYSFLCTDDWMVVIPRSSENCNCSFQNNNLSLSINAMGFAGSILFPSYSSLTLGKSIGPLEVIRSCAFPC